MNNNEKPEFIKMDVEKCEMDAEKKARRSSILKPQKQRNPFSTLDFTEATPDNTSGKASRRVSFASSNFVKPFAADPEKNTIWDNTYEEEINHTDSTKSSNEQTHEAKSYNILNVTSIYSPESDEDCLSDSSPTKISTKCVAKEKRNPILYGEMTLSDKFIEPEVSNKDKENMNLLEHNISLITQLNTTVDISLCNNTNLHMKNTIHGTNIVNKENVNPIINDISLVAPTENSLQRSTKLKFNNIKVTNVKPKTVSTEKSVHIKSYQEVTRSNYGEQTLVSQCDMELTTPFSVTSIKENIVEETVTNIKNRTIYGGKDMEITETLDVKSKTIYFDKRDNSPDFTYLKCEKESDLEFTCVTENTNTNANDGKNDDRLYQSGAKMEITSNLLGTTNEIQESMKKGNEKNETICFNKSKGDMEFTDIFQVQTMITEMNNDFKLNDSYPPKFQKTVLSAPIAAVKHKTINKYEDNQSDGDTKYINTSSCKENASLENFDNFDQLNGMEFQAPIVKPNYLNAVSQDSLKFANSLPVENNALKEKGTNAEVLQQITNSRRKTIYFNRSNDDMEMTATSFEGDTNQKMSGNSMDTKAKNAADVLQPNANSRRKTVYFNRSNDGMEMTATSFERDTNKKMPVSQDNLKFANSLPVENNALKEKGTNAEVLQQITNSRRKTIYFNRSNDDVEMTATSFERDTNQKMSGNSMDSKAKNAADVLQQNANSRRKTVYFNQSNDGMEMTATSFERDTNKKMPGNSMDSKAKNTADVLQQHANSRRKTVYFNRSNNGMELTATSFERDTTKKMSGNSMDSKSKNTVNFSQSEGDMELTKTLQLKQNENVVKEMAHVTEVIDCNQPRKDVDIPHSEQDNQCVNQTKGITINLSVVDNEGKYTSSRKQTIPLNQIIRDKTKCNTSYIFPNHEDKSNVMQLNELLNNNANNSFKKFDKHIETLSCSVTNDTKIHSSERSLCITDAVMVVKENHNTVEGVDESGNTSNMKKIAVGMKRPSDYRNDEDAVQRKICHVDQSAQQLSCETVEKIITIDSALPVNENATNIETVNNKVHSNVNKAQKIILQTSPLSNGNILYSEPMMIKLKSNDFSPTINLPTGLNLQSLDDTLSLMLNPVSTPFTSFRINLTDMSPCVEDTQQLIHATFSKPECSAFPLNKENISNKHSFNLPATEIYNDSLKTVENIANIQHQIINSETYTKSDETSVLKNNQPPSANPKEKRSSLLQTSLIFQDTKQISDDKFLIILNELPQSKDPKTDNRYSLDLTPPDLVPSEFDDISLVDSLANQTENNVKLTSEEGNTPEQRGSSKNTSTCNPNHNNSTLRSELVLTNVKKYLIHYEIEKKQDHTKLIAIANRCEENDIVIKDVVNELKLHMSKMLIVDLEETDKQVMEENFSSESETSKNLEEEEKVPSMAGLVGPKSLYKRVSGVAESCKNHWKFHKMEDDYYYFYTLFGTLPFKVHVHPDMGIVYSVETYTNVEAFAQPLCWYQLKLFQHKLKGENLLPVLGANFDILTLLDYVNMTMEEIVDFHTEYLDLVKRRGKSYHFRMNQDLSISFEVLNIDLIIWWIISLNMSPSTSVGKDDIKAESRIGEPVNEEHIKCIVENTPKGPKFFSNFIENVDEYVKRIGKKIKFKRGHRC